MVPIPGGSDGGIVIPMDDAIDIHVSCGSEALEKILLVISIVVVVVIVVPMVAHPSITGTAKLRSSLKIFVQHRIHHLFVHRRSHQRVFKR